MATLQIPGQQISVEIPDEGTTFRGVPGNAEDIVFKHVGGQLLQIPKSQFRGDFESLPKINPGLEGLELARRFGIIKDIQGTPEQFLPSTTTPGEVITVNPDPSNPNAPQITSSLRGNISPFERPLMGVAPSGRIGPLGIPINIAPELQPRDTTQRTPSQFSDIQRGISQAQQTLGLAQQQRRADIAAGKPLTFQPGTTIPFQPTQLSPQGQISPLTQGFDARGYLGMAETLANAFGIKEVTHARDEARKQLLQQFTGKPTFTDIFKQEVERRGIAVKEDIVSGLDKLILQEEKTLRELPEAIKAKAEIHGVTQAQLNRIISAEARPKQELLRDLLEERNVAERDIQRTMSDIDRYVDLSVKDEATRLKAFELSVDFAEGDYKNITDKQKEILKIALGEKKDIFDLADEAAKNGAPQNIIRDIINSSSPEEAVTKTEGYLQIQKPRTITSTDQFGNVTVSIIDQKTGQIINQQVLPGAGKPSPGGQLVSLDQSTVDLMAQTYLTTGQIPSLGFGTAGAAQRGQIFKRAAQIANQRGLGGADIAANKAAFTAFQAALRNQQTQFSATKTALGTLDKQLGLVEQFSNKVDRTGVPILNKYVLYLKGQVAGDAETQALQNAVQTASYEFAKILAGAAASIAGVTVTSAQDAQNLLNANMTTGQINTIIGLMKQESNFRLNSQQNTIQNIQNEIRGIGTTREGGITVPQTQSTFSQEINKDNFIQQSRGIWGTIKGLFGF